MKKDRLILLGIDGMDYSYTASILHKLPNINQLSEIGTVMPFESVFPPDSIPSWITAYTGKDPSEHGVLESVNYLDKGKSHPSMDTNLFKERTFWDYLGKAGYKVCVINPLLAYPVWEVNGVMVNGPFLITGDVQVSDPKMIGELSVPKSLGGMTDFPSRKELRLFCEKVFRDTKEQAEFGVNLLGGSDPDFFFQVFLTMDRLQHFLWRYTDKEDPTYPGNNEFENSIEDFYVYMDQVIGMFLRAMGPHDKLIVISDHGHGRRCTHCFNINEYLRLNGYVKSKAKGGVLSPRFVIEKLKNRFLKIMNDLDLEDYISVVAAFVPNAKALKKGKHITDNSRNLAYASDFTGTNPFGGVCINKQLVPNYEEFRTRLIQELSEIHNDGEPVFVWARKREDLFEGSYVHRYPDILFRLKDKYGVNWSLHTDIFTINPTHKKISGGHKELGVFFSDIPSKAILSNGQVGMTNLFPTILDFYGLDEKGLCKGRSLLKVTDESPSRQ